MQIIKFNKSGSARGGKCSRHGDSSSNEIDGGGAIGRGNRSGGDSGSRGSGGGGGTSGVDGVDRSGSKHLETCAQRKQRETRKMRLWPRTPIGPKFIP